MPALNVGQKEGRRGAPPATRDRLKAAARRLFAERGLEGTTVRDILTAAGEKNGASLNYYFGTKDELIREITVDLFTMMDQRWGSGLSSLRADRDPTVRDYVRLLIDASDTSHIEEVPTSARLAEAVSHQRYHLVLAVLKEQKLSSYDDVLGRIALLLTDIPPPILRQRLIFLTRYLSSVFALRETISTGGPSRGPLMLATAFDEGNVVDTAVGLLTAEVVDARVSAA